MCVLHVCKPQSQQRKSSGLQSVPVLWHSLTIPDRCVAASPRETSAFRFRKVACWVQPKHILLLSQETQGKVSGFVCVFSCHYPKCVRVHENTKATHTHTHRSQNVLSSHCVLQVPSAHAPIWHVKHRTNSPPLPLTLTHTKRIEQPSIASTWCQCDSLFVVPNSLH